MKKRNNKNFPGCMYFNLKFYDIFDQIDLLQMALSHLRTDSSQETKFWDMASSNEENPSKLDEVINELIQTKYRHRSQLNNYVL